MTIQRAKALIETTGLVSQGFVFAKVPFEVGGAKQTYQPDLIDITCPKIPTRLIKNVIVKPAIDQRLSFEHKSARLNGKSKRRKGFMPTTNV
ncbi:hypothetical protein [Bradyrhizobium sp. UFLA05-112]